MSEKFNYSLLKHNTFGIDARCRHFVEFDSTEELQQVALSLSDADLPLLIIGKGSNLLLTHDFDGTVLHSTIMGKEVVDAEGDSVFLRCGSGETWDDVVAHCVENGWYGAENLSLIPGDVGASAVQNIGAYGTEVKDLVYKVEAVELSTGHTVTFYNADCAYAYRDSVFKHELKNKYVITYVTYKLSVVFKPHLDYGNIRASLQSLGIDHPTARQLRDVIIDIRRSKLPDPEIMGNAGSFFVNPIVSRHKYQQLAMAYPDMPHYDVSDDEVKIPTGWMIEQCGWKGRSLGQAGVHSRQALVLVNLGGASGNDIVNLYKRIANDVQNKFGIDIHPEVNVI